MERVSERHHVTLDAVTAFRRVSAGFRLARRSALLCALAPVFGTIGPRTYGARRWGLCWIGEQGL